MKKYLNLFLLMVFLTSNILSSPLIFKVKKEITNEGLVELATFDTTRYKQIRIGIQSSVGKIVYTSNSAAEIELKAAERELERKIQLLEKGEISRSEYDIAVDRRNIALSNTQKSAEIVFPPVSVFAVEGGEEILLAVFGGKMTSRSIVIDTPPSKIRIKVSGKNTYSLYVWGQ